MEHNELERYRLLLLKHRESILTASNHNLEAARQFGSDGVPDVADEGLISYNRMVLSLLGESEKKEIVAIDDALARIRNASFGKCRDCGELIGEKRLNARPQATSCVRCQSANERRT